MRRFNRFVGALMAAAVGFQLCACGNVGENRVESTRVVKDFEALTEIKDGRKNLYLISKSLDNNYWNTMAACIKQAADEMDCNVYYSASTVEAEWETQVELLDKAVEANADAIIIAPDNSVELAVPVSDIYKNGTPVVLIDTAITLEDYDVCFMTDNLIAGERAAEEMLHQLENMGVSESEKVQIGIEVGSETSQTISERLAGFSQYWTANAPESWEIIDDIKINGGDIDLAKEYADELIKEYPDMKGMFGANNGSTVGVARGVVESGRKDIAVVGFDYSDDISALIDNDEYHAATVIQKQYDMGYKSVEAALAVINGTEIGDKFVDTGVVVVDNETIETSEVKAVLESLNL